MPLSMCNIPTWWNNRGTNDEKHEKKWRTCCESRWEPMAMVTDRTVGMAIGMPPMSNTNRLLIPWRYGRCWMGYMTIISITMPIAMEMMQKLPIAVSTCKIPKTSCLSHLMCRRQKKRKRGGACQWRQEEYQKKWHADWENLLEMAHIVCGINQMSSLSKKGVHTSGNHNSVYLPLLTCRSRKHLISWLLCGWHWLPSQCRLANHHQQTGLCEKNWQSASFL